MHVNDEQVRRYVDGELEPADETMIGEHVSTCAECSTVVADARRDTDEVNALLRQLDHPMPARTAGAIIARARRWNSEWMRHAATIVIAAGVAGIAYAAPYSPLPRLTKEVLEWANVRSGEQPEAEAVARDAGVAGIAVEPGERLVIRFTSAQSSGELRVSLTDSAAVLVRVFGSGVSFTSGDERLVIDNQGSRATFDVHLPRTAPRIEILVGDRRVLLKDGAQMTADDARRDGRAYVISLASNPR